MLSTFCKALSSLRSNQSRNLVPVIKHIQNCHSNHQRAGPAEMNLKTVVSKLNKFAPTSLAEKWDNVGLLVEPSPPHVVKNVVLTNDLTEPVLDEAIKRGANLILSYHPPIFVPLKTLTQRTWKERIVVRCIENRIAVFSPHTSYDALAGGVNDWLVLAVGDGKVEPIHSVLSPNYPTCKGHRVQVTGENSNMADFHNLVTKINGAVVNPASQFLWSESGQTDTQRQLSINCSEKALSQVVAALSKFPDLFQATEIMQLSKPPIPDHGMGRLSKLTLPLKLSEAVAKVKGHLKLDHVRLAQAVTINGEEPVIKRVAVCAGSGGNVLKGVEADLFVTGEMSHHEVLEAVAKGTSVILCDHSNTERGYLHVLKDKLNELLEGQVSIFVSEVDCDPLKIC